MHKNQGAITISRRQLLLGAAALSVASLHSTPTYAASPRSLKNGIDISWLPEIEGAGGKFVSTQGKRISALALMKKNDIAVGRIRVFVRPSTSNGEVNQAILLAKRLKAVGIEICIDLHYSDTWADPAHQTTPIKWQSMNLTELSKQVSSYTEQILRKFVKAGVSPQWVQIGNEIAGGFLWPLGKINSGTDLEWNSFVALHNAATKSLRKVLPRAKSIVHLECGGDSSRVRWWLDNARLHGLQNVDVVGLSYYSQWQGPLENLNATLNVVAREFSKPVLIAETAYPWTSQTFGNDVIDTEYAALSGFPLTPSGQRDYVLQINQLMRALPRNRGIGVWWWEGFATRVSDSTQTVKWNGGMANSALVGINGHELPALNALRSS